MPREIHGVVLHHAGTGSLADWTAKEAVDEFRRQHKRKGWRDIGYHKAFDMAGGMALGRPLSLAGAHTLDRDPLKESYHNRYKYGYLAVMGTEDLRPSDAMMNRIAKELAKDSKDCDFPLDRSVITGHKDHDYTACPGNLYAYIPEIIERAQDESRISVRVDGVLLAEAAILHKNRSYLPVRAIADHLGLGVSWDGDTKTVTLETQ